MQSVPHFRSIRPHELDIADELLRSAFRSPRTFVPAIERCLASRGGGFFVACEADAILATCGVITFEDIAYVGQMAVASDVARRGLGAAMLGYVEHEMATRGVRGFALEASDAGKGLYAKHGYVALGTSVEWRAPASGASPDPEALSSDELAQVVVFDARRFGRSREDVIASLARTGRVLVEYDARREVVGYLVAQEAAMGPFMAVTPDVAETLLSRALALSYASPPRLLASHTNAHVEAMLESRGFVRLRTLAHMRKGACDLPSWDEIYGKGSPATG